MNAGPARIPQWMVTLDHCRELGVPVEVFTNSNADAYIFNASNGMTKPMRWRTAKADVYGHVSESLAKATDRGALDRELTAEDRERLVEFLKDFGKLGGALKYEGGERRGYSAVPGATGTPGVPLGDVPTASEVFASGVGRHFSFEFGFHQAMLMFQPVGGMDRIPQTLTKAIGARRVRTGAVVPKIVNKDNGVTVMFRQGDRTETIKVDYCVCALPPNILARLSHNLGPGAQRALEALAPFSAARIGLEYGTRWWELDHDIYGGITTTDLDIATVWHPSHGFHDPRGVLIGYCDFGVTADSYARLTPEERERRAVTAGVRIYRREYRTELESPFSHHWRRTPHGEAAWHSVPGGPERVRYRPLNEPTGRVHFAGDWLSHTVAWQHGAFESARRAVTALHARVLRSDAHARITAAGYRPPRACSGRRHRFTLGERSPGMPGPAATLCGTNTRRSGHSA